MSGDPERPFDDGRWPSNFDASADCFLCGKIVVTGTMHAGAYDEPPAGPQLPLHLPCAAQLFATLPEPLARRKLTVAYHIALAQMSDANMKRALRDATLVP